MTGCAANNCKNKSEYGVKMFCFPSDPYRRAVWINKVGQQNWVSKKRPVLCEYHFAIDAFEKERVDGTKKLKQHAIPTIFGNLVIQITNQQKIQKKKKIANTSVIEPVTEAVNVEPLMESVNVVQRTEENAYFPQEANTSTSATVVTCNEKNSKCEKKRSISILKTHVLNDKIVKGQCTKCNKFEQLYKKCEKSKIQMKRIHKQKEMAFKRKIKTLEQQVKGTILMKELLMHSLQTQFKQ